LEDRSNNGISACTYSSLEQNQYILVGILFEETMFYVRESFSSCFCKYIMAGILIAPNPLAPENYKVATGHRAGVVYML